MAVRKRIIIMRRKRVSDKQALAENLRHLRTERGLSLRDMARRLCISRRELILLECGIIPRRVGCGILLRMQNEFQVSVRELFARQPAACGQRKGVHRKFIPSP